MKRWRISSFILLSFMLVLSGFSMTTADAASQQNSSKSGYYFVQLEDQPVATYSGDIKGLQATKVESGKKLNVQGANVKNYRSHLAKERNDVKDYIRKEMKSAKVVSEYSLTFNGMAVKLTDQEAKKLANAPGVKQVIPSKKYRPVMNRSHEIVNDLPMWNAGYDGKGIKVAVIDSGVDVNHPYLKDSSLPMPAGFPKVQNDENGNPISEWYKFTSNKVIAAKVYGPDPQSTPEAIGSHGTHVAGTIAGISNYEDPTGVAKSKLSGVAPKAYLGNYNVFPCEDCSADDIYIVKAVEDALNDGMDVANLSLGGDASPGYDPLVEAVNAASDAGMTVVIAAGNDGPGPMTVGSPGIAEKVITVGAVSNKHFIGKSIDVTVDGEKRTVFVGSSDPGGKVQQKVSAPLAVISEQDGLGCDPINADLTGKVAVLKRGGCTFSEKALNAQAKGAAGVILINNSAGDPTQMSVEPTVTIPMVMVSDLDGAWISKAASGSVVMEPSPDREFLTTNDRLIANFSSRGPTVNYTLKPDIASVGVNVYSSVVGGGLASYNGTSMATPHVAGAAALLKQAHPDWKPQDIKSALMATANAPKSAYVPVEVGAGVMDVAKANKPSALAYPASLSFGPFNKGAKNQKIKVTLKNPTSSYQVYTVVPDKPSQVMVNKPVLAVAKGKSATFTVTANVKFKKPGDYQGYITVKTLDGKTSRIPYYFNVQ
ncbi:S8 family serine peptidase [Hazenella coriacea]|uniref:Peptidase inhibitor I9 n=1 Tax=Hazenella coriacea TaxID=1179467 RepID=A0A4R3L0Z3_9BACL|nr:S8 family serine peptidase [Hazenella coriacea]TCS92362.1 peptidase inhibitor I9 [Hazenella coriacea]